MSNEAMTNVSKLMANQARQEKRKIRFTSNVNPYNKQTNSSARRYVSMTPSNRNRWRRSAENKVRYSNFQQYVATTVAQVGKNHDHYLNMLANSRVRETLNNQNKRSNNYNTRVRKNTTRKVKKAVRNAIYRMYGNA